MSIRLRGEVSAMAKPTISVAKAAANASGSDMMSLLSAASSFNIATRYAIDLLV